MHRLRDIKGKKQIHANATKGQRNIPHRAECTNATRQLCDVVERLVYHKFRLH